jgi:hypothetical protein
MNKDSESDSDIIETFKVNTCTTRNALVTDPMMTVSAIVVIILIIYMGLVRNERTNITL